MEEKDNKDRDNFAESDNEEKLQVIMFKHAII
jgi:hypothetical protein